MRSCAKSQRAADMLTVGYGLEQKTVYFRMIPLSLSGGSQETNTTELVEAAALTPAGGPGTGFSRGNNTIC